MSPSVRVIPADTRRDLNRFIDFPWEIYRDDPHWVPPLKRDMRVAFDREKHPFHRHSEAQPFLALRDDRVVGRICAIRNRRHEEFHDEPVGFFGFFESLDDPGVAAALFDAVRVWLRERGLEVMRGPTSFSTNEVSGLLVDGEAGPPFVMMAHNPPYYAELIEGYGFEKAKDLWAWAMDNEEPTYLERAERIVSRRNPGITVRTLDRSRYDEELERVRAVYNEAWEKNWGFVPMSDAEIDFMADELKLVIEPRLALFMEDDEGETIGFGLALPDFNQVLRHLDGRLFPLGLFKALRLRRKIDRMRVIILGVVPKHRGKGLDALLYVKLFREAADVGVTWGEMSWILEDNHAMNAAIQRFGARLFRTYRIYDIAI
ncbi:MAG: N-acetyltransferase [Gemmatimonadota bacterium]|nr:N-acetyltransferase [Gemmatimonadota bacterium]